MHAWPVAAITAYVAVMDKGMAFAMSACCTTGDKEQDRVGAERLLISLLTSMGFNETVAVYRDVITR